MSKEMLILKHHEDLAATSEAIYSPCEKYRYSLFRKWASDGYYVAFIGLNPSTATEKQDDNTVRRCGRYARQWGYDGFWMLNLFAYRATDPRDMKAQADPTGPDNDEALLTTCKMADTIVCCWGGHGEHMGRAGEVRKLLSGVDLLAFGFCKNGEPKHPLYLRKDLEPVPYEIEATS